MPTLRYSGEKSLRQYTMSNQEQQKLSMPVNSEGVRTVITQEFDFTASHYLPNHDGICKEPHEHQYKLKITLSGLVEKDGPKEGMIFDFADLETLIQKEIICVMEHNSLPEICDFSTTIENLALWIGSKLNDVLYAQQDTTAWVKTVTLYEEPTRSATVKFQSPY